MLRLFDWRGVVPFVRLETLTPSKNVISQPPSSYRGVRRFSPSNRSPGLLQGRRWVGMADEQYRDEVAHQRAASSMACLIPESMLAIDRKGLLFARKAQEADTVPSVELAAPVGSAGTGRHPAQPAGR